MKLEVLRYSTTENSTSGLLFDITNGREFICYTLEDPYQKEKVYGKTRIPSGCYEIELYTAGSKHKDYTKKYGPKMHKGMLLIKDVPNFEGVLIHTGNTPGHTSGCLLVGDAPSSNVTDTDDFLGLSGQAYRRMYSPIAKVLTSKEKVTINFRDFEKEKINV